MDPYAELCAYCRKTEALRGALRLLGWDQETYMPAKGGAARSEQSAELARIVHERETSPRLGELITACEADAGVRGDERACANVRELRRDYDRQTRLPADLVAELARTGSRAQDVWKEARRRSDFAMFRPWLERMVDLARQKAACYGTPEGGEPYDALLNEYEPDARAKEIEAVFTPLAQRLGALVAELRDNGRRPDDAPTRVRIAADRQHAFGLFVIGALGFDLDAGRLDTTTHPFCEGLAAGDTRLTTRYHEERFTDALYGTMHECGHGLYEQGLPKDDEAIAGTPLAQAVSLGIHESQSRMWENFVGRSLAFWEWALPHAQKTFGPALQGVSPEEMYRAVNTAEPSHIRVEADEATYNLHIMLRFEIERALLRGDLSASDVPGVWNETFRRYLGIDVPDDRRGCLQDVHWSFGLMGYFPTYCLGNLYAAQFWEAITRDIPDLEAQIRGGSFAALLGWLREHIHRHGRRYGAGELCRRATGRPLSAEPLLRYLSGKLRPVYGLA